MSLAKMSNEELWTIFMETRSLEIRNEIVSRNLGLAQYVANRYRSRVPDHQSIEDLVSYAYEGLIDAVEKYDPSLGFLLPTYAVRRISGAILDGLRKEDPLPRSARKRVKDYEVVQATVFEMIGRDASGDEMAQLLRLSTVEVGQIHRDSQSQFKSLDALEVPAVSDSRHEDPTLQSQISDLSSFLARKLTRLTETERRFLLVHYAKGLTLADIASALDIREVNLARIRKEIMGTITGGTSE